MIVEPLILPLHLERQFIVEIVFALSLAIACAACAQEPEQPQPPTVSAQAELDWVIERVQSYKVENDIPAIGVGVLKDGKVMLLEGFGVLERGSEAGFTENSLIQLGSVTKVLTGTLLNSLILEGQIDPQSSIVDYFGEELAPDARVRLAPVTVEHLLHHRSGLPRDPVTPVRADHNSPMLDGYPEETKLSDLSVMELAFEPGTAWSYSNFGYGLLGLIAERKTDSSFEQLLQKYVAVPYGMQDLFIRPTVELALRIATPYRKDDRQVATSAWDMGKESPSGGVYTTTEDMLRLLTAQIAAYEVFGTTGEPSPLVLTARTASTELGDPPMLYGYGLFERQTRFDHFGDLDGYGSDYRFSPELGLGMVALTTSGGVWLDDMMDEVFEDLRQQYLEDHE